MKEFMDGCSIPKKASVTNDLRHGCVSNWGDPHTVEECSTCKLPDEIKKKCKCYSNYELKEMQNCPESIRNSRLMGDQFCAYEDDDGTLMGCGPGCCDADGCPGECCKSSVNAPEKNRPVSTTPTYQVEQDDKIIKPNTVNFILYVLVTLLVANILLLTVQ